MVLYDSQVSGNCFKVRLLLAQLGIACERVELDVVDRSDRAEVIGDKNPSLRVPTIVLDDGRPLGESNAIISYFAEGTPYLPEDRYERAQVLQWLFFEQYQVEPNLAVARFLVAVHPDEPDPAVLAAKQAGGREALGMMERHLEGKDFFVAGRYTIADIALYGYAHVAADGGVPLDPYPNLRAWIERVAAQPGYVPIDA